MTTCVYCKRDIDGDGYYRPFDCKKIKDSDDWEAVCMKCHSFIYGGREVPAP